MKVQALTQESLAETPVDDDSFGRELFYHGRRREECTNPAQRAGFDAAARDARALIVSEWLEADIRQIAA